MTDILSVLAEMRDGNVAIDISRKFTELVEAVAETNMKGEMSIKFSLSPSKQKDGQIEMKIDYDSKVKKPEFSIGSSIFFLAQDGTLTREDPRQQKLFEPDRKSASVGEPRG